MEVADRSWARMEQGGAACPSGLRTESKSHPIGEDWQGGIVLL